LILYSEDFNGTPGFCIVDYNEESDEESPAYDGDEFPV
jgi:hypothetical protein